MDEMGRLEGMGEWDERWGREEREVERKRRRDEWEEKGWGAWEMGQGEENNNVLAKWDVGTGNS